MLECDLDRYERSVTFLLERILEADKIQDVHCREYVTLDLRACLRRAIERLETAYEPDKAPN